MDRRMGRRRGGGGKLYGASRSTRAAPRGTGDEERPGNGGRFVSWYTSWFSTKTRSRRAPREGETIGTYVKSRGSVPLDRASR